MADKTYTQEEHDALVAQVDELKAKVSELSQAAETSEIDVKIAAATAELEAKVTDLQSQLDSAVLETEAAKNERDSVVSYLEGEAAAADEAAALDTRKAERLAAVKEAASFPDEYLEANADRFAAMSDETFAASLEDWKTIAVKAPVKGDAIPAGTALTASSDSQANTSVLAEVLNLRFKGVDVRTVR